MRVTITAAVGRVQVELTPTAAMVLMMDAMRTACIEAMDASPAPASGETGQEPDAELIRYLTEENCTEPGDTESAEGTCSPQRGEEKSGGVTADAGEQRKHEPGQGDQAAGTGIRAGEEEPGGQKPDGLGAVSGLEVGGRKRAMKGYWGFLYTKCGSCGEIRGYCAKSAITEMHCSCGHRTPLERLVPMTVRCQCCEKVFKYQTNLTEENFTIDCLGCGAPVEMVRHGRTGEYVTY